MLEISEVDISNLADDDLRTLVGRLAIAELRKNGCPRSAVTFGGNQDAPDGGIDVRVDCPIEIPNRDFLPRRVTGFQVKKSDMSASAIRSEMRPRGQLREAICDLAKDSGAYVIVSSSGSVADKSLTARRDAMRQSLLGCSNRQDLHTDFYDRHRLVTWTNEYPGIVAWVRTRVGRVVSGWSGVGDWDFTESTVSNPYLWDDDACVVDESGQTPKRLTLLEGIEVLRSKLSEPRACVRLVGLSGVGKTRFVQALFEEGVSGEPLDSNIAIYTDYSEETEPTARDMARQLIGQGHRSILVVDNCNPATHGELARLCTADISKLSLISIEYDVRDDEPERTEVFRLDVSSLNLVRDWLQQRYPDLSDLDRRRISEFSDGNFRVAGAIAETVGKSESVGSLKSGELFERIFRQRNQPDKQLLQLAEDLSLLYSIHGEEVSDDSELARVGAIRMVRTESLYEALVELRRRGVVQARGVFRAILPQAIANRLAYNALDRIHPLSFDRFCQSLTERMVKSVSRRLGFLHESEAARSTISRWLLVDGPLGDLFGSGNLGFQIVSNIAPAAPELVLSRIESLFEELSHQKRMLAERGKWTPLIRALGYDSDLFERAALLLARFVAAQADASENTLARSAFLGYFHLYLSGTQATPKQRHALILKLAASEDDKLRSCAFAALKALLLVGHFTSTSESTFGARSRDWGWFPKTNGEIWDWYKDAVDLVTRLLPDTDARVLLAERLRGLWRYPGSREAVIKAGLAFHERRPWIEGWIQCRATLRYSGPEMPRDVYKKLVDLTERLKPTDILNRARAVVFSRMPGGGGWDYADGEDDQGSVIEQYAKADQLAMDIGKALADDPQTRSIFLTEVFKSLHAHRALWCGRGLCAGATSLIRMWNEIVSSYKSSGLRSRTAMLLGGYIDEARKRDARGTGKILESCIADPDLVVILPYLQACAGINEAGVARLRRALSKGGISAEDFSTIANSSVADTRPTALVLLLRDIAALENGVSMALEILFMRFFSDRRNAKLLQNEKLKVLARDLLFQWDGNTAGPFNDYSAGELIRVCLTGNKGCETSEVLCKRINGRYAEDFMVGDSMVNTIKALFEVHPLIALDAFVGSEETFESSMWHFSSERWATLPVEGLSEKTLQEWADQDPKVRYILLGKCIRLFTSDDNELVGLSPLFLTLLRRAPDKGRFLGDPYDRIHPRSWTSPLFRILELRKTQMSKLEEIGDEEVSAWVADAMLKIDKWIASDRIRERGQEESFE